MTEYAQQLKRGAVASLLALLAGATLLLMLRVDTIEYSPHRTLYGIAAVILLITSIGPLHPATSLIGQVLLWNGIGWTIALAVLGLESVGSLPLWPLILAALALTFWPRTAETTLPPVAIAISLLGGFLICWLGWSDIKLPSDWLDP